MAKYTIRINGREETHSSKDDVIIALTAYLLGYGNQARVEWPDGFVAGE